MAISQIAKDITERIYVLYGSDTGWLFGIPPDLRFAVVGIVQCVLDQIRDAQSETEE